MKKTLLLLLIFAKLIPLLNAQPLNLDFELKSYVNKNTPWSWYESTSAKNTNAELDSLIKNKSNYSLKINNSQVNDISDSFNYEYVIDPTFLVGKLLSLSGYIKTEGVINNAGVKISQFAEDGTLIGDTTQFKLSGTQDWQVFILNYIIGSDAKYLGIELFLNGHGTAWFDDLVLSVDGNKIDEVLVANKFTASQMDQLEQLCTPLFDFELDPHVNSDNFLYLKKVVKNASIISFGESTHGTKEFFQFKHLMLDFAVRELGVTVFAIEDNLLTAEKINNYVKYGIGEPEKLIQSLFGVWNNEEVLDMIKWIREYNILNPEKQVEFVGFDVQDILIPLDSLYTFLKRHDSDLYQKVYKTLPQLSENWWEIYSLSQDEKFEWTNKANEVYNLIVEQKINWLNNAASEKERVEIIYGIQAAQLVKQFARNNYLNYLTFYRDSVMAQNIQWQLSIRKPGTKMLVWAHDAHINKGADPILENNYYNGLSMGTHLRKWFGDNYCAFGLSTYSGTYRAVKSYTDFTWTVANACSSPAGSLDEALHEIAIEKNDYLFVNLQSVLRDKEKYSWLLEPRPIRMNNHVSLDYSYGDAVSIPNQFDGIFYFDITHAATAINR